MEEEIDKFYSTLDNAKVRKEQVGATVVKFKLGTLINMVKDGSSGVQQMTNQ